jgi:hypothetical protein
LAGDFDPAETDSSFGLTAGFAIGFPSIAPLRLIPSLMAMWLI